MISDPAYNDGYAAYFEDKSSNANPHPLDSAEYARWSDGFYAAWQEDACELQYDNCQWWGK